MNMQVEMENQKLVTARIQDGYEIIKFDQPVANNSSIFLMGKEVSKNELSLVTIRDGKETFEANWPIARLEEIVSKAQQFKSQMH